MSEILRTDVEPLVEITLRVNGVKHTAAAPTRRLLSDFLRHELRLTGTHVGCEHGVCGACTVLFDGTPMRSCLMFAVTAQDHDITTVEGLADNVEDSGTGTGSITTTMSPVQQAFIECHGLQCGFCTPGFVMSVAGLLQKHPDPTSEQLDESITGNLCRCTGYASIRRAAHRAAELSKQ